MALTKNVNGTTVPLSAEEEAKVLASWAAADTEASQTQAYMEWKASGPSQESLIGGLVAALDRLSSGGADIGPEGAQAIAAYKSWKSREMPKPEHVL